MLSLVPAQAPPLLLEELLLEELLLDELLLEELLLEELLVIPLLLEELLLVVPPLPLVDEDALPSPFGPELLLHAATSAATDATTTPICFMVCPFVLRRAGAVLSIAAFATAKSRMWR
jgi:hypothetical protein